MYWKFHLIHDKDFVLSSVTKGGKIFVVSYAGGIVKSTNAYTKELREHDDIGSALSHCEEEEKVKR
jgi:hypothetical protein